MEERMTPAEMLQGFEDSTARARSHVARTCGVPLVITVEAMGYRIVPEWVVEQMRKVISRAGQEPPEKT
jgi:hypothetical protein